MGARIYYKCFSVYGISFARTKFCVAVPLFHFLRQLINGYILQKEE
jgi:hypothetical protein